MKKSQNKNILVILVSICVVLLLYAFLQPNDSQKIKVGIDASIPLVDDNNFDVNNEMNIVLSNKLYDKLKEIDGINVTKLYKDGQVPVSEKIEAINEQDLVISVQSYVSDIDEVKGFIVPPLSKANKEAKEFVLMLEENCNGLNYTGNFYYYLEEFKPGIYHEHVEKLDSDVTYDLTIPYFDMSKTNSIMIEYSHKDDSNNDLLIDSIYNTVVHYYGVTNE